MIMTSLILKIIQAKGFANELAAILTVDVDAFYSWSACNIKIKSIALIRV